jgi:4-hydroxybenzoate polyprenyltransferase
MNKFLAFLKLIRFPNLIMIALAQYITSIKFVKTIDSSQLMLISLATIFIAMGGYVLNDIEDIKIDTINKKEPVTKVFSISLLKIYYYSFSIIGLAISFYISYHSKIWFIMFFGFAFFLLWSYAKFFSKFKLIGNIFVSFLIAEAIIIVPIIANITNNTPTPTEEIYKVVLPSYILLAFLFNWMREVIKDLEDQKGDELENRITVPSVFGTEPAKMVVFALVFMASPLIILQLWKLHYNVLGIVILLVAILIYRLKIAKKTEDFKQVSLLMKIIMLLGILYPLG